MDSPKKILKSIEKWAKNQENVRAVILLGSRAHRGDIDRLSDIDLHLIVENLVDFIEQDSWFEDFSPVWLSVFRRENEAVIWKIIYEGGVLVEFIFSPKSTLEKMGLSLPLIMNRAILC
jgi:predicted nucleotidyltransferase